MSDTYSLFATSPGFDPDTCEIVVCIPTYKRPDMLEAALRSLAAQDTERPFAVIVVENDGLELAGARHAAQLMGTGLVPGIVIVEPRQGNCKAYNAGWSYVLAHFPKLRFILGIDDDERARPCWLRHHLAAVDQNKADVQAGPVFPRFEDPAKAWLKDHPIFRSHYEKSGPVPMLYSSANYMISRSVLEKMPYPYLDEAFDFTGGGDSDFFWRVAKLNLPFYWVQEAAVDETMPLRRSQQDWISARGYRNGVLSALIARKAWPGVVGRTAILAKSAALLIAAPFRSLLLGLQTRSAVIGTYHLQVAIGRWMAEFGIAREQYRKPEQH